MRSWSVGREASARCDSTRTSVSMTTSKSPASASTKAGRWLAGRRTCSSTAPSPAATAVKISKRHQQRVSGMGSSHGASTSATRPMAAMDSRKVVCHHSKGRSTVPCCELQTRSNLLCGA